MGHLAAWKVLEQMIADFRKKGKNIPSEVIGDLKSARTMIRIAEAGASHAEIYPRIEEYLANVEAHLVNEAEKAFGKEYVDTWLKRLNEATRKTETKEETPFVAGVPRGQRWIRITPSKELPSEKLSILASEAKLSLKAQDDDSLVIYGREEDVKAFVKKMTTDYGLKTQK